MQASTPPLTPLAAAVLEIAAPESVLDLECGEGDGTLFLAREFPRARVRGIDRSAEAVRHATARVGLDPEGRIAFKQGGRRSIPFPDGYFDLVAGLDASPPASEVARVLRPGGYLVLAYSSAAAAPAGPRAKLTDWRLARLGIEPVRAGPAGDGSFSVGRLRAADRAPGSV